MIDHEVQIMDVATRLTGNQNIIVGWKNRHCYAFIFGNSPYEGILMSYQLYLMVNDDELDFDNDDALSILKAAKKLREEVLG